MKEKFRNANITDGALVILIKNSIWSILGAGFSKVLLFIAWILVARLLGGEEYGEFGIIRNTVLMFSTFAGFSLGLTATKFIAEYFLERFEEISDIIGISYIVGYVLAIGTSILFYLLAPWLATDTIHAPHLVVELRLCSFIIFFSSINGIQIGVLQGFMKFKEIAKINIIQMVISFPIYIFATSFYGLRGAIIALLLSYVIICLLSFFKIRNVFKEYSIQVNLATSVKQYKIILMYSLPAFLTGLLISPMRWYGDTQLIDSQGFVALGVFTAALTFNNILITMAGMISAPLITSLAKGKEGNNRNIDRINILLPWICSIFITLPLMLLYELSYKLFGKTFELNEFKNTFIIVLFFTILMMFKDGFARLNAVHNLQWWSLLSNTVWAGILFLGINFVSDLSPAVLGGVYSIAYIVNILVLLPLYKKKNIIPKKTIETKESFLLWLLVLIAVLASVFVDNFSGRVFILIFELLFAFFLVLKILNTNVHNERNIV